CHARACDALREWTWRSERPRGSISSLSGSRDRGRPRKHDQGREFLRSRVWRSPRLCRGNTLVQKKCRPRRRGSHDATRQIIRERPRRCQKRGRGPAVERKGSETRSQFLPMSAQWRNLATTPMVDTYVYAQVSCPAKAGHPVTPARLMELCGGQKRRPVITGS